MFNNNLVNSLPSNISQYSMEISFSSDRFHRSYHDRIIIINFADKQVHFGISILAP